MKYHTPHGMKNLNYRMDQILCQIFKTISGQEKLADNSRIRIYVNKIENRITFSIKRGYYLKYLTPEAIKLLGRTKSKIKKNENGENVPH